MAIANTGTMTVTNSTFSGDSAAYGSGGAIENTGTMTVTNSTFSGNSSTGDGGGQGGGINNDGTISVTNSTFSGNSAIVPTASESSSYGGGICSVGTLAVTNSTFNGNSATGGIGSFGGGIAASGVASITDVTAEGNSAATGGGIGVVAEGISFEPPTVFDVIDTIFQNTQGGNVAVPAGDFHSLGHNLFSDDPDVSLDPTDLVNTNPLLGPLARQRWADLHSGPAHRQPRDQRGDSRCRHHNRSAGRSPAS